MKKILKTKDQFVGKTMNKVVKLDDYCDDYKLYIFDDAVLIEKYSSYHGGYKAMSKWDIMQEVVNVDVCTDSLDFSYEDKDCHSSHSHQIYNIVSTNVNITSFGEDLIANDVITEHEIMVYANEEIARRWREIPKQIREVAMSKDGLYIRKDLAAL